MIYMYNDVQCTSVMYNDVRILLYYVFAIVLCNHIMQLLVDGWYSGLAYPLHVAIMFFCVFLVVCLFLSFFSLFLFVLL